MKAAAAASRRFDLIVFDKDGTLIDMTAQAAGWAAGVGARMRREGYDESAIDLVYTQAGWNSEHAKCTSTESVLLCGSWKEINTCAANVLASLPSPKTGVVMSQTDASAKVDEWTDEFEDVLAHKSAPLVDLEKLFRKIRASGCQIAVCTADDRRNTDVLFEQFPALRDLVSHVSCGDDENEVAIKPNPLLLQSIMHRLGDVDPSRTMMVGDSSYDIIMGRGANCGLIVGVASAVEVDPVVRKNADVVVSSVDEVEAMLWNSSSL